MSSSEPQAVNFEKKENRRRSKRSLGNIIFFGIKFNDVWITTVVETRVVSSKRFTRKSQGKFLLYLRTNLLRLSVLLRICCRRTQTPVKWTTIYYRQVCSPRKTSLQLNASCSAVVKPRAGGFLAHEVLANLKRFPHCLLLTRVGQFYEVSTFLIYLIVA